MSITGTGGRLGNCIIRNFAVSRIAERFDLKVHYWREDDFHKLGISLFSGRKSYAKKLMLTDENYFAVYCLEKLEANLVSPDYYQAKEITDLLYAHVRKVQPRIRSCNPFRDRYGANQDVFVHVRLGDVPLFSPGLYYYIHNLESLDFDRMYVSTDSPDHPIVQRLLEFPRSFLFQRDEVATLQFASTAKYVVLSHGTFSGIMGYLAFDSTVYYPEYPWMMWHGDMFSIPGWICCKRNEDLPKLMSEAAKIGTEPYGHRFYQHLLTGNTWDIDRESSPEVKQVYEHIQTVKQDLMDQNPFKHRYQKNKDVFVYVRIGDDAYYRPCIQYYREVLAKIQADHVYIGTDQHTHPIVQQLLGDYPDAMLYLQDEKTTLQFASTAKYVVLSNGMFSAVMGYLAFESTVYYPEYPTQMWHEDLFSIPGWYCHILRPPV
jgi:hypothetical protein